MQSGKLDAGLSAVVDALPEYYVAEHRLARVLRRQGKAAAAALLEARLPTSKQMRSGDLAEILGTAFINELTPYEIGVFRLQWKDHRNMAMRGDDLIGVAWDQNGQGRFLKGEAKSRATLASQTVGEARQALASCDERPTPQALLFLSQMYLDIGRSDICDLIDDATLDRTIPLENVEHLMFTFTGNAATALLTSDLKAYAGGVTQHAVNFHVPTHQNFIQSVFNTVIANAR